MTASTELIARQVAEAAEEARASFAREWLAGDLRRWRSPCQITVEDRDSGGEGWVSYETFRGKVENLRIIVRGRLDRIVEYVLPHEVAHATLAVSIGRPIPRWVDEGVALLCESENQRTRQRKTVVQLATTDKLMPLREILRVVDYPADQQELVGFYASCFSLTEYLVNQGGKQRLLRFVQDAGRYGWESSFTRYYGSDMHDLEIAWRAAISPPGADRTMPVAVMEFPAP